MIFHPPTHSPVRRTVAGLAVACVAFVLPLAAQDTTRVAPPDTAQAAPADTTEPEPAAPDTTPMLLRRRAPVGPTGALFRSLLVPGLGQITLGRKLPALFFVAAEATTLTFALRANRQAHQLDATDSAAAADKRQQREDFFVLLAVNHVLAGLEAFVAAHLYDFPGDVKLTPLPGGGVATGFSIPIRIR